MDHFYCVIRTNVTKDVLQIDLTQAQDELKNNPRQHSVVIGLSSKMLVNILSLKVLRLLCYRQEQETMIAALETQLSDRQGYMDTLEDEVSFYWIPFTI